MKKILIIILLPIFLVSCTPKSSEKTVPKMQSTPVPQNDSRYSESEKARAIVYTALQIKGVKKAVAVVTEKTALVGIDVSNPRDVNIIKNEITQKIRSMDGNIQRIEVTADPSIYNRISRLNDDISNGRPLSGIAEDFMKLLKRKNILPDRRTQ